MKPPKQKSGFSFRKLTSFLTGKKGEPVAPESTEDYQQTSEEQLASTGNGGILARVAKKVWPFGSRPQSSPFTAEEEREFREIPDESRSVAHAPSPAAAPAANLASPSPNTLPAEVSFALKPIVDALPDNLKALAKCQGSETVALAAAPLLNQLSSGSVRVCFGELRNRAPSGCIANNSQFDGELVEIPLSEVVARIGRYLPARRPRRRLEVPEDIADAFTIPTSPRPLPVKPETPAASGVPAPKPAVPKPAPSRNAATAAAPAVPVAPAQSAPVIPFPAAKQPAPAPAPAKPVPAPAPKPSPPPAAAPARPAEPKPVQPSPVIPFPAAKSQTAAVAPALAKAAPAPAPAPAAKPAAPSAPIPMPSTPKPAAPVESPKPKEAAAPAVPAQAVTAPKVDITETGLVINLSVISANWPEPVTQEIQTARLKEVSVALPLDRVETALKGGKIVFTWGEICKWMQPPWTAELINESMELELPLEIIAPAFMSQKRGGKVRKKVFLDEKIPDVFAAHGKAAPTAPVAVPAPAKPVQEGPRIAPPSPALAAPAPAPVVPVVKPAVAPAPAPAVDPDQLVVNEVLAILGKGEWALQDLANQTVRLRGVAGLFVATSDGFLVANATAAHLKEDLMAGLPPNMEGEVLAALFPQLFTKLNEYFKDLEFGQMTNLRFTVGNLNIAVYKAADLFIAALGRSGSKLPEPSLEVIASALAKRSA